jgi:hypothetical protein
VVAVSLKNDRVPLGPYAALAGLVALLGALAPSTIARTGIAWTRR